MQIDIFVKNQFYLLDLCTSLVQKCDQINELEICVYVLMF